MEGDSTATSPGTPHKTKFLEYLYVYNILLIQTQSRKEYVGNIFHVFLQ